MPISFIPSNNPLSVRNNPVSASMAKQSTPSFAETAPSDPPKAKHVMFMSTEKTIYSGGNGKGLAFRLEYAENSTPENPIVFASGIDENGDEFQQTINVNTINPNSATLVEMRALEAHLNLDKGNGLSSFPTSMTNLGLHERADFFQAFKTEIFAQSSLKQYITAMRYQNNMMACYDFFNK